jgi:transposase-like protein
MARGKHTTAPYWRQHFAAQAAGGLNTAAYCRQQGIRSSQWYFWRKKLRTTDDNPPGITLVPVKVEPTLSMAPELRVILPNGIVVTVEQAESPEQLLQTLYRLGSS